VPKAKKKFSQNFLQDSGVIEDIVAGCDISCSSRVVEVGPGYGALTKSLLRNTAHVTAIEIDKDAISYLRANFSGTQLSLVEGDFLDYDLKLLSEPYKLIGNLPYHISTPILFHIDRHSDYILNATLMLQREVCDRLTAAPGTSDYGKLTVTMQLKWDIEKLFDVPPEAFDPQPKVWSSVIRLVPRVNIESVDQEAFKRLVFAAFSKRRKTLRNALKGLVSEAQFKEAAIDPIARAERLSVSDFVRLTNTLQATH